MKQKMMNSLNQTRSIRQVRVAKLKWLAHSNHSMIYWKEAFETEPPFTSRLTDEQLVSILGFPLQVPRWLNNPQTEADTAVIGQVER